jgi:pseudaminic acid biosynthesis-associated methylase
LAVPRQTVPKETQQIRTRQMETDQIRTWAGDFGREYTNRNVYSPSELDEFYRKTYGVTRTEINRRCLESVPRDARILEVGCNMGNQLMLLEQMGFTNLYGVEIQGYALDRAKQRLPHAVLTEASAFSLPFDDRLFDLVFTSGVLIHIAPADLPTALAEIYRCSKRWIWGFEYYAPKITEVAYRGHDSLLWKADYARLYLKQFPGLELVREDRIGYLANENVDAAFLLRKKSTPESAQGGA